MTTDESTADNQRIPFGEERTIELPNGMRAYIASDDDHCHDCGVSRGDIHIAGCDEEQCPVCERQLISCEHGEDILS